MAQAQENMKKMQEQNDRFNQTQDPQERQKLLQNHYEMMQKGMGMMQGMGSHMMGNGHMIGCKGMSHYYSKMTGADEKASVHDGSEYGDATTDDGSDDAPSTLHDGDATHSLRMLP